MSNVTWTLQVRTVVQMFTGRAELLDKGETTAEHAKNQREEAEKIDKDKENTHPQQGGLFGGLFSPRVPFPKPVIDVEDGVARCPLDAWELLDGVACTRPGCSYTYPPPPDSDVTSYSDDLSDEDFDGLEGHTDDDFDGDDDFGDYPFGPYGPYAQYNSGPYEYNFPGSSNLFDHLAHVMDDYGYGDSLGSGTYGSEDEDDSDDEDMSSFIDDEAQLPTTELDGESDRSTVVGGSGRDQPSRPPNQSHTVPEIRVCPYVDTSDEDEDDEDEDDEGEDDEGEEEVNSGARRARRPREVSTESSSPAYRDTRSLPMLASPEPDTTGTSPRALDRLDSESTASSSSPPPRPIQRSRIAGSSARAAIAIEDSDDDQPVGPRRTAQRPRRRPRYSPY